MAYFHQILICLFATVDADVGGNVGELFLQNGWPTKGD